MTREQAAEATKAAVRELGGAFFDSPRTLRHARLAGLSEWAFYVAGRGGALGDVRAATVAAALGFIAPEVVGNGWEAARKVTTPSGAAAQQLAECCRWGIESFGRLPLVDRLVGLTERIVVAADPVGMPLFAAWRAMPVPDDTCAARAAVLLHLLREHRAGAHLIAVRAAGLTPLEAIISGPDGEAGAVAHGWRPPFPQAGPLVRRRLWAEAVTDGIVGQAYAALETAERVELVNLLNGALAAVHAGAGR